MSHRSHEMPLPETMISEDGSRRWGLRAWEIQRVMDSGSAQCACSHITEDRNEPLARPIALGSAHGLHRQEAQVWP
jgi:hypothetical protein